MSGSFLLRLPGEKHDVEPLQLASMAIHTSTCDTTVSLSSTNSNRPKIQYAGGNVLEQIATRRNPRRNESHLFTRASTYSCAIAAFTCPPTASISRTRRRVCDPSMICCGDITNRRRVVFIRSIRLVGKMLISRLP